MTQKTRVRSLSRSPPKKNPPSPSPSLHPRPSLPAPHQSSTWSLSLAPLHAGTVHLRPVTLKPTEGISKSRMYSASHLSHLSAKQFPSSTASVTHTRPFHSFARESTRACTQRREQAIHPPSTPRRVDDESDMCLEEERHAHACMRRRGEETCAHPKPPHGTFFFIFIFLITSTPTVQLGHQRPWVPRAHVQAVDVARHEVANVPGPLQGDERHVRQGRSRAVKLAGRLGDVFAGSL